MELLNKIVKSQIGLNQKQGDEYKMKNYTHIMCVKVYYSVVIQKSYCALLVI